MRIVQLRITGTISTSRYGAMSDGDILRTDADYARHLVEDLKKARYDILPMPVPEAAEKPARRARKSAARTTPAEDA